MCALNRKHNICELNKMAWTDIQHSKISFKGGLWFFGHTVGPTTFVQNERELLNDSEDTKTSKSKKWTFDINLWTKSIVILNFGHRKLKQFTEKFELGTVPYFHHQYKSMKSECRILSAIFQYGYPITTTALWPETVN